MASDHEEQEERPLRERVFSWAELKGGWRLVRGHGQSDEEEE